MLTPAGTGWSRTAGLTAEPGSQLRSSHRCPMPPPSYRLPERDLISRTPHHVEDDVMQAVHTQDFILLPVVVRDEQRRREDALQVMAKPRPGDVGQRPGEHELCGRVTLPSVPGNPNKSSVSTGTNVSPFPTHLGRSSDNQLGLSPPAPSVAGLFLKLLAPHWRVRVLYCLSSHCFPKVPSSF